jgi:lipid-A-disaccharide synthase
MSIMCSPSCPSSLKSCAARRPADDLCRPSPDSDANVLATRQRQGGERNRVNPVSATSCCCPGRADREITGCCPISETAVESRAAQPDIRFFLPTVPRREAMVREIIKDWPVQPEIVTGASREVAGFR